MLAWDNFFAAQVSASATLAGLLFVAVSINLARVLEFPNLPGRAGEALLVILSVLAVASCGLVPGQGLRALGVEVVAISVFVAFLVASIQLRARKHLHPEDRPNFRLVSGLAPSVLFAVGGILLVAYRAEGLYWFVPGALFSLASGVFNAWVLLIEILR